MADGGAINLRMSLKGAEQVKAELASIGPAGSKMARDLDRAMRQPTPAMKALDVASNQARLGVDNLAGRAGPAGNALGSLGTIGLATAAALGVLAIGLTKAREGMAWAAEVTDVADRIGVSTTALQQWRFVADEVGVSTQSLEGNMEKLNATVGAFKSGIGDGKLKPVFEALGITPGQLASVKTADDMLLILADTLGQVQDRAVQVKFAKALGVEESLPIIRLGSERIRELTAEAERLGLVTGQDVVQALDAADRQMEIAQQRIDTSLRLAVSGLASDFADVVTAIASVIGWLVRLDNQLAAFSGGDGSKRGPRGVVGIISDTVRRRTGAEGDAARDQGLMNQPGWMTWLGVGQNRREYLEAEETDRNALAGQLRDLAAGKGEYSSRPGWERSAAAGGGGGGGGSREAERRQREIEAALQELSRSETRQDREVGQIYWADRSIENDKIKADLDTRLDAEERAAQRETLRLKFEKNDALTAEVRARLGALAETDAEITSQRNFQAKRDEEIALSEARVASEQAYLQITSEILSIASADARTSAERREIELALLDIAQRRQRAELELAIAAETDAVKRQGLEAELAYLPQLHAAQTGAVLKRTAGPWESWRDSQRSAGEVSEFLEGRALDAMDGLNEGLRDAWSNAENAGDAFARMGQVGVDALEQIKDALLEVAIQRLLIQPMVDGLFGGKSGAGGLLGSLIGNLTGAVVGGSGAVSSGSNPTGGIVSSFYGSKGFAHGGVVGASGLYPIGERGLELMQLPVGSRIYDHDSTSRLITDMGRARTPFASPAAPPVVNLQVINQTSQPVQAQQRMLPDGTLQVMLREAVRGGVKEMGADGSLARAQALTPQPIRR